MTKAKIRHSSFGQAGSHALRGNPSADALRRCVDRSLTRGVRAGFALHGSERDRVARPSRQGGRVVQRQEAAPAFRSAMSRRFTNSTIDDFAGAGGEATRVNGDSTCMTRPLVAVRPGPCCARSRATRLVPTQGRETRPGPARQAGPTGAETRSGRGTPGASSGREVCRA